MLKISVIIPCYNAERTLGRCIESVLATHYRPLEVIIVDDASTDKTAAIAASLAAANPDLVRLVSLAINRGPATARNAGAAVADGAYLFFLDSDTQMLPDALHKFATRIQESGADAVSGIYSAEPLNDAPCAIYKALLNNYFFVREGIFEYEVFNGAVGGLRREVFERLGGYNENLQWGMDYENEEFGHRMHAIFKMLCDPSIQARHVFPNCAKMTQMYFVRISLWAELFVRRLQFEKGGLATTGSALATLSVPPLLASLAAIAWWPWSGLLSVCFLGLYMQGYGPFLLHVGRRRPSFLASALILNFWFSLVLSAGAGCGVIMSLRSRKSQQTKAV
jgi:glycosyltransferase involved in cell wall biosynthesis